jgi:uncharacterized protein YdeI (YjbR/CyaY-like superfamily)
MGAAKVSGAWSAINTERVERMLSEKRMAPAGLEKVTSAKLDGSWNALDAVEALEIPVDLEEALASYESARENFDTFPRSVHRGILEWISQAKSPQTRTGRIQETARLAEKNIRANQWPRR